MSIGFSGLEVAWTASRDADTARPPMVEAATICPAPLSQLRLDSFMYGLPVVRGHRRRACGKEDGTSGGWSFHQLPSGPFLALRRPGDQAEHAEQPFLIEMFLRQADTGAGLPQARAVLTQMQRHRDDGPPARIERDQFVEELGRVGAGQEPGCKQR